MEMLEGGMEVERCDTSNSFEGSSVRPVGYHGISWDTSMVTQVTLCRLKFSPCFSFANKTCNFQR